MGIGLEDILKGQIIPGSPFVHDTSYTKILRRDDLEANTTITASTALTGPTGHDTWTAGDTFLFILPTNYDYTTVLDGVAVGNVKLRLVVDWTGQGAGWGRTYGKYDAYLISMTSGGVATTLGSQLDVGADYVQAGAGASTDTSFDIPFMVSLDNQTIPNGSKLILKIVAKLKHTNIDSNGALANTSSGYLLTALNSNNVMVKIPIVSQG